MFDFKDTKIDDVKLISPSIFEDRRGYFFETYNEISFNNNYKKIIFVQDNESKSKFGTLRGLHFQKPPYEQSKLIRVVKGKIQDIAVDLRPASSTYRQYVSVTLDDQNKKQLFIPKGFAHAFLTLSNEAIVIYKVDNFYSKQHDSGVRYDDPLLNINWKLDNNIYMTGKVSEIEKIIVNF